MISKRRLHLVRVTLFLPLAVIMGFILFLIQKLEER